MAAIMTTDVNSAGGDEAELRQQRVARENADKEAMKQRRAMKESVGEAKWDVDRIFKGNEEDGRDITDTVMAVITAHDVRRPDKRRRYKAALAHCINAKPTKVEGRRNRGIPKERRTLEVLSTASTTEYDYKILQASRFFSMRVRTLNEMLIEVDKMLNGKHPALLAPVLLPSESGSLGDHSSKTGGNRGRNKAARRSKAAAELQEMSDLDHDPVPMEAEEEKGPKGNEGGEQRERTKWHGAVLDPDAPREERFKAFIEQLFYHVDDEDELECLDWVAKCMADPSVYGDDRIDVYQRGKILEYFKSALPHIHVLPFYLEATRFSQFVKTTVIKIDKDIGIKDDSDDDNHPMLKRYDEIMEKRRAEAEAEKKAEEKENETKEGGKKRGAKRKLEVQSTDDQSSGEREAPGLAQFIGQDCRDADLELRDRPYGNEEVVDNESSVGGYLTPPPHVVTTTMTSIPALNADGDRTPLADQLSVGMRKQKESELKEVKEEEESDSDDDEQDEEDLEFQRKLREMSFLAVKEEPKMSFLEVKEEPMDGDHPVETPESQLQPLGGVPPVATPDVVRFGFRFGSDDGEKEEEQMEAGDVEEDKKEATQIRRPRGRPPQSITPQQPSSGKKMEKDEKIGHSIASHSQSITPKQLKMEDDEKMEKEARVETRRQSTTSRSQLITPKSYDKKMKEEEIEKRGAQKGRPQSTSNESKKNEEPKQPETRRSQRVSQEYDPKKYKK